MYQNQLKHKSFNQFNTKFLFNEEWYNNPEEDLYSLTAYFMSKINHSRSSLIIENFTKHNQYPDFDFSPDELLFMSWQRAINDSPLRGFLYRIRAADVEKFVNGLTNVCNYLTSDGVFPQAEYSLGINIPHCFTDPKKDGAKYGLMELDFYIINKHLNQRAKLCTINLYYDGFFKNEKATARDFYVYESGMSMHHVILDDDLQWIKSQVSAFKERHSSEQLDSIKNIPFEYQYHSIDYPLPNFILDSLFKETVQSHQQLIADANELHDFYIKGKVDVVSEMEQIKQSECNPDEIYDKIESQFAVDGWKPNARIDLSDFFKDFIKSISPRQKAIYCAKGFKDWDPKNEKGNPITQHIKKENFFDGDFHHFKEISLNTEHYCRYIAFDVDMPYEQFKGKLEQMILDGIVPAPSFVVIRLSSRKSHVVYLLDDSYSIKSLACKKYFNAINNFYVKQFGADPSYRNYFIHNPFYQYDFYAEQKSYLFADEHGYVVEPPPVLDIHGKKSNPNKLEFVKHNLYKLSLYAYEMHEDFQFKEIDEVLGDIVADSSNKKDNHALNIKLNKKGQKKYDDAIKIINTGPEYRNNTLFVNGLYALNHNKKGKVSSEQGAIQMLHKLYKFHFADKYLHLPPMSDSEITYIAKKIWKIHYDGNNHVHYERSWIGSDNKTNDVMAKGLTVESNFQTVKDNKNHIIPIERYVGTPIPMSEVKSHKDWIAKQSESGKISGVVRAETKGKRMRKIYNELVSGVWRFVKKGVMKEAMAAKYDVSIRTIERDLADIRKIREFTMMSYETCVEQVKALFKFKLQKSQWKYFNLHRPATDLTSTNFINQLKKFLDDLKAEREKERQIRIAEFLFG